MRPIKSDRTEKAIRASTAPRPKRLTCTRPSTRIAPKFQAGRRSEPPPCTWALKEAPGGREVSTRQRGFARGCVSHWVHET